MSLKQLSLSVSLDDYATFANYYTKDNAEVIDSLVDFVVNGRERVIYLCGVYGSGRSHLLQAVCHERHERDEAAMYVPLSQCDFSEEVLDGMETLSLVCLDDIDGVMGDPHWDEALFHFYNRAQQTGTQVLVSAKDLPSRLEGCLPDLRSRLCSGLVLQLMPLSDSDKILAMKLRARRRGFDLTDEVSSFLLRRYPRDTHALFGLLEYLDRGSLQEKRKITVPFAKEIIEDIELIEAPFS